MLKKIVAIGPESTGKSTLCTQLAKYFNTQWVPEYARGYLLKHGTNYSYDDLATIAKGQLLLEDDFSRKLPQNKNLLFLDTNMYVMKVWCEFVFNKCHEFILTEIVNRKYDLYLLCNTDLPWVKDELREYPDPETREILFNIYKDILVNQNIPWVEIKGDYENRFEAAKEAVKMYVL